MIIVSQDKMELVNFDKVENIWICPDEEGRFTIEATADTNATLGYYKTEERAKKVLQEIIERYEHTQYIKGFGREIDCYEVGIKDFAYEMPKE